MPEPLPPLGQHPDPVHVLVHLSDTHLLADTLQYGVIDTQSNLSRAMERVSRIRPHPQALIFTGDLADVGEPDAYRRLRQIVEPVAADAGAEVIWVMGNHDNRKDYSRELFGRESTAPQDRVHEIAGLRIVVLDSTVPGWHHGELGADQLEWLSQVLATPAEHGTVLAMHHPPLATPLLRLAELIELHDQQSLADVVAGSDVRTIIAGHIHYNSFGSLAGIPVSAAGATCYSSDLAPNRRLISSVNNAQSFNTTHLYADHVVHTVVPLFDSPEIDGYGLDVLEPLRQLSAHERFELVAKKDSPLYRDGTDPQLDP